MKEYIIGRGNTSDIVIPDESDQVSRSHCTLRICFWGKILLKDNSSNGTSVNGEKIEPETWRRVSRKDKISLANVWDFDWKMVPKPYRITKIVLSIVLVLLLGGGGAAGYIFRDDLTALFKEKKTKPADIEEEDIEEVSVGNCTDSTATDKAAVDSTATGKANKKQPGRKRQPAKNHTVGTQPVKDQPKENPKDNRIRAGEVIL